MSEIDIRPWDGSETELGAIADVYATAFAEPPYDEDPEDSRTEIIERIRRYATEKPDFRLLVSTADGSVTGFVLGMGIGPGDWWWGRLETALSDAARADWLRPRQFSIAELAIAADRRRSGIARELMAAVLRDLPYDTALLGCYPEAEPAKRLYESLSWTVVDAAAQVTPNRRIQVMGLRLPVT